jgi:rhodanese-related sulfurtransferase
MPPEQVPAEDDKKFFVLDVRDAGQFAKEHVPGASSSTDLFLPGPRPGQS